MRALGLLLCLLAGLTAACFWEGDDEPEYAPVRPYAGLNVASFTHEGETYLYVSEVQEGHPAAIAGVQQDDLVVSLNGEEVGDLESFFRLLEEHQPGDFVDLELERFIGEMREGRLPETEPVQVRVELIEQPLPSVDTYYVKAPSPSLREDDELRLGLRLVEITRPLAEHFDLPGPAGVFIEYPAFPFSAASEAGFDFGDVLMAIQGERVNSLADVQRVIDQIDEDEPLRLRVWQDGKEREYTLDPLGPLVPGANHLPPDARQRLADAIERGDLHPERIEASVRPYFWRPGNTSGGGRVGAITELTSDSITLEVYSSGEEWSASITLVTKVSGPGSEDGLSVGEFVHVLSEEGSGVARFIFSLAGPLPPRP